MHTLLYLGYLSVLQLRQKVYMVAELPLAFEYEETPSREDVHVEECSDYDPDHVHMFEVDQFMIT